MPILKTPEYPLTQLTFTACTKDKKTNDNGGIETYHFGPEFLTNFKAYLNADTRLGIQIKNQLLTLIDYADTSVLVNVTFNIQEFMPRNKKFFLKFRIQNPFDGEKYLIQEDEPILKKTSRDYTNGGYKTFTPDQYIDLTIEWTRYSLQITDPTEIEIQKQILNLPKKADK